MKHYQGMMIIKQFVPPLYHKLIKKAEHNINRLLQDLKLENDLRLNNKIPEENINKIDNKRLAETKNMQAYLRPPPVKVVIPPPNPNYITRDDNETVEQNNRLLKPVSPQVTI